MACVGGCLPHPYIVAACGCRHRLWSCSVSRLSVELFAMPMCASCPSTLVFIIQLDRFFGGCIVAYCVASPLDNLLPTFYFSIPVDALPPMLLVLVVRTLCCCYSFVADTLPLLLFFDGSFTVVVARADALPPISLRSPPLWWMLAVECGLALQQILCHLDFSGGCFVIVLS